MASTPFEKAAQNASQIWKSFLQNSFGAGTDPFSASNPKTVQSPFLNVGTPPVAQQNSPYAQASASGSPFNSLVSTSLSPYTASASQRQSVDPFSSLNPGSDRAANSGYSFSSANTFGSGVNPYNSLNGTETYKQNVYDKYPLLWSTIAPSDSSSTSSTSSASGGVWNGTVDSSALSGLEQQGVNATLSYKSDIESSASKYDVPAWAIASTIYTESRGNPTAGSAAGAYGLGQFMPATANGLGVDLSNPAGQIDGIAKYLSQLHSQAVANGYSGDDAWLWAKMYYGGFHSLDDYDPWTKLHGSDQIKLDQASQQAWKQAFSVGLTGGGTAPSQKVENLIQGALTQVGNKYTWGGTSPASGFDCSGLIYYYAQQQGINIPRTAQTQYNATQRVTTPQRGDLVFFANTDPNDPDYITHVGIYLGNGMMLDARNPNDGIVQENLNTPYWQQHLAGYGRLPG